MAPKRGTKRASTQPARARKSSRQGKTQPEGEDQGQQQEQQEQQQQAEQQPQETVEQTKEQEHNKKQKVEETQTESAKETPTYEGETKTTAAIEKVEKSEFPVVLEKGKLYFFYRPRVQTEEAHSLKDVQRFYMLMSPDEEKKKHRLLIVASKRLPDPQSKRSVTFAYVDYVGSSKKEVEDQLEERHYDTKTRGERNIEAARLCGEARYEICSHHHGHVHLMYVLEVPEKVTEVQKAFHIHEQQTVLVQVRNPHSRQASKGGFAGLAANEKAEYPDYLQEKFHGKLKDEVLFTHLMPEFLDYQYCELLLVGIPHTMKQEFGQVAEELIKEAHEEAKKMDEETHGHRVEATYEELKMKASEHADATEKFV